MLAEMYGVTRQELQDDKDLHQRLLEHAALRFQPDAIMGLYNNPEPSVILGDRMTRWPGHGLPANGSFQFVEGEYMKPEDYDAFLDDPADWAIRKYWPRVFKELEGLALLPPLGIAAYGAYSLPNLGVLTLPPVVAALQALGRAAEAQARADVCAVQSVQRPAALGIAPPTFMGSITEAPFDFMSDTLRGMRGIMLDIHRRPEQLLAAEEKVLKFQLEYAINWSRATGINVCFIPLHRGSDGFMSLPQFEKFYWPQLKALQVGLVEEGNPAFRLPRRCLGPAPHLPHGTAQGQDRGPVPVERHLQGERSRRRDDVYHGRHVQLAAGSRHRRRGALTDQETMRNGRQRRRVYHEQRRRRVGRQPA